MSLLRRIPAGIMLFGWLMRDIALSSIAVAKVVLGPRALVRPRFATVALASRSPAEITLVANYITLTPGTLTVDAIHDASIDAPLLLVHDLTGGETSEGTRAGVLDEIEPRVLRVTR